MAFKQLVVQSPPSTRSFARRALTALLMSAMLALFAMPALAADESALLAEPKYLDRETCLDEAPDFVEETGLDEECIARELFAHAVLYYGSTALESISSVAALVGVDVSSLSDAIDYTREHAGVIDLGGDSDERLAAYDLIWELPDWFLKLMIGDTAKLQPPTIE